MALLHFWVRTQLRTARLDSVRYTGLGAIAATQEKSKLKKLPVVPVQADPQIASRFEPFAVARWDERAALREFVVCFGRLSPLHKPSPFGDKAMIQKLWFAVVV